MTVSICPRLPGQLTVAELSLPLATILCRNQHLLPLYVTIACEDEQMQAHKIILSVCSPFFRYTDLQAVLNFMYHGEFPDSDEICKECHHSCKNKLNMLGLTSLNPLLSAIIDADLPTRSVHSPSKPKRPAWYKAEAAHKETFSKVASRSLYRSTPPPTPHTM